MDKKPEKLVPEVRFKGFTDDWEQRKLGEAAEIIGGGTPSTQISNYWNGDINWYTPAEISNFIYTRKSKRKISMEGLENSSARLLPVGTVLFTSRAGIGKTAILSKEGTTNQGFQSIVPNKKLLDSYFIFSLTNELKKYGETHGAGSTFIEISGRELAKAPLKLPALKEQKKIGGLLHQVDELIFLQQRKLEQLKQLKKAMLQQLFVDKNNKQPKSRFKNFKGNWEQHRLEEVAQVTMGQSPSSKNYTDNPNDYVLVQGNADLKSNKISPRVWTKEITKQVHKGEIIMTVRAPVGYLAMANMDAVIGRGVAAIDGNKYLYYLLQTKLMDRTWEKLSSGSTFESISSNDIKNLEIKVTETEEEKLITKLMNTVTYFVTLQKNNLTQLTTLKKYLLQNLFI